MSDPAQRMRELRMMQEKIWRERQQAQLRNEAAQYLEGRIARDPMAGPNHHSLAPILQELGDHDEALRRLQFAAKANPENLNVRNDLALAIFKRGREHWARALKEFTYILRVDADNFLAHKNIAAVYAARGRYEKALEHALEAVKLRPDDAAAHRNLAQVYDVTGNSREAVVHNRRAIALGPGRHGVYEKADAEAYRRVAVQRAGRGETASGHAHEHYDAYRALAGKPFVLPDSERTVELLVKAKQDL